MTEQEQAEFDDLERQIAEATARVTEIETRRAPSPLEQKRAELAAAKRKAEDAAVIEKLEPTYGKLGEKIASANTAHGMIVVKAPDRQAWKEFSDATKANVGVPFDHQETFVKRCAIWPDKAAVAAILREEPAACAGLSNLCAELGGFKQVSLQGK